MCDHILENRAQPLFPHTHMSDRRLLGSHSGQSVCRVRNEILRMSEHEGENEKSKREVSPIATLLANREIARVVRQPTAVSVL